MFIFLRLKNLSFGEKTFKNKKTGIISDTGKKYISSTTVTKSQSSSPNQLFTMLVGGKGFSAGSQAFMLGDGRSSDAIGATMNCRLWPTVSAAALPLSRAAGGEPV